MKMYLVFDIGGAFVKHALIDALGNIQTKKQYSTPNNIDSLIEIIMIFIINYLI
jgi:predicted NBD/HSP70 family sugar kinase